jgi:hypothetical protein
MNGLLGGEEERVLLRHLLLKLCEKPRLLGVRENGGVEWVSSTYSWCVNWFANLIVKSAVNENV